MVEYLFGILFKRLDDPIFNKHEYEYMISEAVVNW